jgi:hypothetical protein
VDPLDVGAVLIPEEGVVLGEGADQLTRGIIKPSANAYSPCDLI